MIHFKYFNSFSQYSKIFSSRNVIIQTHTIDTDIETLMKLDRNLKITDTLVNKKVTLVIFT